MENSSPDLLAILISIVLIALVFGGLRYPKLAKASLVVTEIYAGFLFMLYVFHRTTGAPSWASPFIQIAFSSVPILALGLWHVHKESAKSA